MIEIKNWFVRVPNSEYLIGYHGEHMVHRLSFCLLDSGYNDWIFKLDIKQGGKRDVLALEVGTAPEGLLLGVDVKRGLLACTGIVTVQIRAVHTDGRERHTNQFYFSVRDSIRPGDSFPNPLPTEFYQMEQSLAKILKDAVEAAERAEDAAGKTDFVLQRKTYLEFPSLGEAKTFYVDTTMNKTYRWDEEEKRYFVVGSDYEQIKVIDGGKADG